MNFFLLSNQKRQDKLASPDSKELWLPVNVRSQGFKNDRLSGTTNSSTNKINVLDWINSRIDDGSIVIPTGAGDGNGIYTGSGTVPANTIVTGFPR